MSVLSKLKNTLFLVVNESLNFCATTLLRTGKGIRRAIDEGICTRKDLYVTTKLWNTYHHPNHVPLALERCLADLGLDYVDEFLIHFPISMEVMLAAI